MQGIFWGEFFNMMATPDFSLLSKIDYPKNRLCAKFYVFTPIYRLMCISDQTINLDW